MDSTSRSTPLPKNKAVAQAYADTAAKAFFFFTSSFGPAFSGKLNLVELPDDTVPSAWAPEIAAIAGRAFSQKVNYRLLANTIAHQWWGTMVSPATRNDWWLDDGFARYSEAMYVEHVGRRGGLRGSHQGHGGRARWRTSACRCRRSASSMCSRRSSSRW